METTDLWGNDMDCISCGIFDQLDALAQGYARDAFGLLAPSTNRAYEAFVGAWAAWVFVYHGAIRGDLTFQMIFPRVLTVSAISIALMNVDLYWQWIYQPAYDVMNGVAVTLIAKNSTGVAVNSISGMLGIVEHAVFQIFQVTEAIMGDAGINSLWLLPAGVLLAVPYIFVWGIFMAFCLEGIFKLLAITAVSPVLIAAAGFSATRGFAISGLRVVLGGVLTVCFAAVAMGFTVSVMNHYLAQMPLAANGYTGDIKEWVFGTNYWRMFALGFISVLFHLKAATLAANISGASDGPGAAAAVVGGGMMAVGAVKAAAMKAGRAGADRAGRAAGALGNANRNAMWDGAKQNLRSGGD